MSNKLLPIVAGVLALLLVVGVLTFAGPCVHDDGTASVCQASQQGVIASGAVALVACVGAAIAKGKARGALLLIAAVAGMFAAFAPGNVFALCMMATMRCHTVMQPFAQFIGIALAAVALIGAVRAFRMKG